MPDPVFLLGWNDHGMRLANDLLVAAPAIPVVIVSTGEIHGLSHLPRPQDVTHVQQDPTREATLRDLDLPAARAIVILSDLRPEISAADADSRTVLISLAVRAQAPEAHLIAEIQEEHHLDIARLTSIDEFVIVGRFGGVMLSRSLHNPAMAPLFTSLFASGAGVTLVELPVPDELVGQPFSRAQPQIIATEEGALAGLRRRDELHLPPGEDLTLERADLLLTFRPMD